MKYGNRRSSKIDEADRQEVGVAYFKALNESPATIDKYETETSKMEGRTLTAFVEAGGVLPPGIYAQRQENYSKFWGTLPVFPQGYVGLKAGKLPRPAKNGQLMDLLKGKKGFSNMTNPAKFGKLMEIRKNADATTPQAMKEAWLAVMPQGRFSELLQELTGRVKQVGYLNITDDEIATFLEFWLWHLPVEGAARERDIQGRAQQLLGNEWVVYSTSTELDQSCKVDLLIGKLFAVEAVSALSVKNFDFYQSVIGKGHPANYSRVQEELATSVLRWISLKEQTAIKQTAFAWISPKGELFRWSGLQPETPKEWSK